MAGNQLAAFAAKMQGKFGEERIPSQETKRDVLTTTSLTLDWALRLGGIEMGAIYEIVGEKDSFKTSLAIGMLGEAQRRWPDRGVAYIDLEKTYREDWARRLGLLNTFAATQAGYWQHLFPVDSEDASDMARQYAGSGLYSLIVIDSVGGMESRKAFNKEAGDDIVGKNAQVITRMAKHLATLTWQNQCAIILINQYRANLSGYGGALSAGPLALQYATTGKIEMKPIGGADGTRMAKFGDSEEPVSKQVRARVTRLKNATPGRRAEFWFNIQPTETYGPVGINVADEYATMGIRYGVIAREGKGSYYVVPGADKVNGQPAVRKLLLDRPELLEAVRK
ncbi:MAG: hypothetical protein ACHQ7M_22950, partial [Chloroflexota bacterium]